MSATIWSGNPEALIEAMTAEGLHRAYVITDPDRGDLRGSHPVVAPLVEGIGASADYRRHRGAFFEIGQQSKHLLAAFVHDTTRGQAAGGVRFWRYERLADFVVDGLRLSRGMGQKCALAGLWWGGGKGVIARREELDHRDPDLREAVYRDYGRFISGLRGCYVTAEDVGTTPEDMAQIHRTTRHTTCIPPEQGGSGNPSILTASGAVVGIEAALAHLGRGGLAGKTVAMQGLGNVSVYIVGELLERKVARIVGADVDDRAVHRIRQRYADAPLSLRVVAPDDHSILAEDCDVVSPNAVGATLNPETIPTIKAAVVCGAANNQLADSARDGRALRERGVLYVPDFLTNRMGIVNCANEQYGRLRRDPAILDHLARETPHGVFRRAVEVFERAEQSGRSTAEEAEALADELGQQPHPLWPGRAQQIIDDLVAAGWDKVD